MNALPIVSPQSLPQEPHHHPQRPLHLHLPRRRSVCLRLRGLLSNSPPLQLASKIGYVSAGVWAGITIGRFLLVYPSHRIGEKIAVTIMTLGAIALQILAWLIPNLIGEVVAVAILGVFLGTLRNGNIRKTATA
ncbi:uncharacterized protein APUU_30277S [Aspergillus puulaauensis]|uniref:Uncharacterized protein n=1 Tax=Aspergillus puulaauensis TaxID=1220207 RepID=A0A7R7XIR7_9EURO|nr:uncharacterized protein APUU_30277S [Aspergillus puulaauensis]BCS22052.1 hypothetical protein APUU_30277S [Aspergillus puulaauensis]